MRQLQQQVADAVATATAAIRITHPLRAIMPTTTTVAVAFPAASLTSTALRRRAEIWAFQILTSGALPALIAHAIAAQTNSICTALPCAAS